MKFLNGVTEEKKPETIAKSKVFDLLPEKVDENLQSEILQRIERMNKNYSLFMRRNNILSAIALMELELKEVENEITK